MKFNISIEDLNSLSLSQKQSLNSIWLPDKYDHVVASVCKDVENDVYEDLEFIVGEVLLSSEGTISLKRLRLLEDMESDEMSEQSEADLDEDIHDFYEFDAGDIFLKDNCHPLFSIGQLIHYIRKTKAGREGFNLDIPSVNELEESLFAINDRFGEVDKNKELVDLLFNILKEQL